MAENEVKPGFDRRSLIKKGLVGAGIAVTAPVISTFNTVAFAVSIPGCHKIQYKIAPSTPSIEEQNGDSTECPPAHPSYATATVGVINPFVSASGPTLPGRTFTFTISPDAEDCVFTDASANKISNQCFSPPGNGFNGIGTTVLTYDRDALGNDNGEFHVRLLICCTP